jgi:hypothetical protein
MPFFSVSPSVNIREIDLTGGIPILATTVAAIAGVFRWGPLERRTLVDSETNLWARFGKPTNLNPETFFTAASFLAYGNQLYIARAANTTGTSPLVDATVEAGNATVTGTNTTPLTAGDIIAAANTSGIVTVGAKIATIVNTTSFTLDSASHALSNGTVQIQFVDNTSVYSAIANVGQVANLQYNIIKNPDDYISKEGTFDSDIIAVARYPGAMGNSLRITFCDSSGGFTSTINLASLANGGATVSLNVGSNTATVVLVYNHDGSNENVARLGVNNATVGFQANMQVTDFVLFGNNNIGTQGLKITEIGTYTSNVNSTVAAATFTIDFEQDLRLIANQSLTGDFTRFWEWFSLMDSGPGQSDYVRLNGNSAANDEMHVVVVDEDGLFSGVPGTVLETYKGLSRASDARGIDGGTIYYQDVINERSQYVYVCNPRAVGYVNTALNISSVTNTAIQNLDFQLGFDGSDETAVSMGVLSNSYDLFKSAEDVDVSLIMQGKARGGIGGEQLANYITDNICEIRKDCVVFISPEKTDVVNQIGFEADNVVEFRNRLRSTSYGFMDCGYKYMYDRYNDIYRYIPLNGDMAGLAVRTDQTNDPWWSFAGYNRGQLKNVVKLAWNPRKAFRDQLYKNGVNPVINDPGQGFLLFGDKTLLNKDSAFSRINVRRLFITIEKAIATAAKFFLFEFNDAFTRALLRNMITPYLRNIQGRRGIYDFIVICDSSNNDGEVIDRNELNCDIYIKPARSINWVNLNFIAVRTAVSFNEVIGRWS